MTNIQKTSGDSLWGRPSGFTLLELMAVLTIIAVLAGIGIKVGRGLYERAKISRAQAELAGLGDALEMYRSVYGDYPQIPSTVPSGLSSPVDRGEILFNAVCGKLGPKGNIMTDASGNQVSRQVFVELSHYLPLSTAVIDPEESPRVTLDLNNPQPVKAAFFDPWYHRYRYYYKGSSGWENPSFVLYSMGPDGKDSPPDSSGNYDPTAVGNPDNIYYNRN